MAESSAKLNQLSNPDSGAEMSMTCEYFTHYKYADGSTLILDVNGTRRAIDASGALLGESPAKISRKGLMNGLASSQSRVILRKPK